MHTRQVYIWLLSCKPSPADRTDLGISKKGCFIPAAFYGKSYGRKLAPGYQRSAGLIPGQTYGFSSILWPLYFYGSPDPCPQLVRWPACSILSGPRRSRFLHY